MRRVQLGAAWLTLAITGVGTEARAQDQDRTVLVELFTSHGCNMCPGAEKLLSSLPSRGYDRSRVIVLAFHVDYFNDPWKDPFSKKEFSSRNWAYHRVFQERDPKTPNLYFTPMIMVGGKYPTSGYYHEGEKAAWEALKARLDRALREAPDVAIELKRPETVENNAATWTARVRPTSNRWLGRELLAAIAVVEDGLTTHVPSGENAGKDLVDNHVVRSLTAQSVTIRRGEPAQLSMELKLEPGANPDRSHVVVFLQDEKTGAVVQATEMAWNPGKPAG